MFFDVLSQRTNCAFFQCDSILQLLVQTHEFRLIPFTKRFKLSSG